MPIEDKDFYHYEAGKILYQNALDAGAPHVKLRPRLLIEEDQWCALYGENLQDGVAGFGDSPDDAMRDFDLAWLRKLPKRTT